jgi:hypothetical protein
VAAPGLLYRVDGKQAQRVDGQLVEREFREAGSHFCPLSFFDWRENAQANKSII